MTSITENDALTTLSRSERRKQRTRQSLINAAQELIRQAGYESITVQDVTDTADVGLGTFYNYFESKGELFDAILQELNNQFFCELDSLQVGIEDPAFRFVITLRHAMYCIINDTAWAWFFLQSGLPSDYFLARNTSRVEQEIQVAADAGRFIVDDPRFAIMLMQGMSSFLRQGEALGYQLDDALMAKLIQYALSMLGMADQEAAALSKMPMPDRTS